MPRASFIRRWGLTTRGRDYQLTPAFPRLPGIIPEGPASGPPLARQPLRKPSVLSKNRAQYRIGGTFSQGVGEKNLDGQ